MREEGESGARSAISSHPSFLSFAQHRGWVCSSPHVENMRWFLGAREATGGSRLGGAQWSRRQLQPELYLASDLALMQNHFWLRQPLHAHPIPFLCSFFLSNGSAP